MRLLVAVGLAASLIVLTAFASNASVVKKSDRGLCGRMRRYFRDRRFYCDVRAACELKTQQLPMLGRGLIGAPTL